MNAGNDEYNHAYKATAITTRWLFSGLLSTQLLHLFATASYCCSRVCVSARLPGCDCNSSAYNYFGTDCNDIWIN